MKIFNDLVRNVFCILLTIEFFLIFGPISFIYNIIRQKIQILLGKHPNEGDMLWFISAVFISLALKIMRIRVEIDKSIDIDLDSECNMFLSSHASILEILILECVHTKMLSFISKESLLKVPFVGMILKICQVIPINRDNLSEAKASLAQVEKNIITKRDVVVFPEGKRRRKKSMNEQANINPFKKGPFHLAKKLKFRIVPIYFVGCHRLWSSGTFLPKPGTIYMKYLTPIPVEIIEKLDHNQLREYAEEVYRQDCFDKTDEQVFSTPIDNKPWIFLYVLFHVLLYCALKYLRILLNN